MKMDLLKQKFLQVTGVSLDLLDENPDKLEAVFSSKGKSDMDRKSAMVGRGYPFWNQKGIDAQEKDRQNLEILSKW